ncbi:hypothetical protein KKJ09_21275 [Xenorhabdus bovienii]|uniref:DNA translocase FtsK n=1 Tax=Xenorhabdus bovienii TaxID=40576 RepID=UPI0023B21B74|nr:DNA translocase FtsK [Xenorhabdus bovienii]MDE9496024.1 hypothetical protein [Xenorhabdus bovienii]MDE9504427.1 hypothetical protein [Xenorhabdus bovienii]MDE9528159.1 hypothetical protein [Xenorhabdus bovienii]MDE9571015.1 hypothetical protein [Xenorhabdus bovienii]
MDLDDEIIDPLFSEAVDHVISSKSVSADDLKQRFNIGYNRATTLLEQMEEMGIIKWAERDENSKVNRYLIVAQEVAIKRKPQKEPHEHVRGNTSKKGASDSNILGYGGFEWFMGAIGFIVILIIFISCSGKPSSSKEDYCLDDKMAYIYAEKFIFSNLKSPSSAKFASYYDVKSYQPTVCKFNFIGYVDAQNSFGAMIRTNFNVTVRYEPNKDKYYLEHLDM